MDNGTSTMQDMINAHRVLIDILAMAAQHGAKYMPHTDIYTGYGTHISIGLTERETEFPASEVCRWQLALPGAWDVKTTIAAGRRLRYAEVEYQGYTVHIRFAEPEHFRYEARQALTLAALA